MNVGSRKFGPTNVALLALGVGTHGHGHAFGGMEKEESLSILSEIYSIVPSGERILIDTAPRYGHGLVESWLGEMSEQWSDRFLIATKCGRHIDPERDNQKDFSYSFLASDIEGSLKRLRTNRLFLAQLHNPTLEEIRAGEVFSIMEKIRGAGLIEWYGLSVNHPIEAMEAIRVCTSRGFHGLASIQFLYSILTKEGSTEVFQAAQEAQIAIIAREVLFRGFLTDRFLLRSREDLHSSAVVKLTEQFGLSQIRESVQVVNELLAPYQVPLTVAALRYSVDTPGVTTTLVGVNNISFVAEMWRALDSILPNEARNVLDRVPDIRPYKA